MVDCEWAFHANLFLVVVWPGCEGIQASGVLLPLISHMGGGYMKLCFGDLGTLFGRWLPLFNCSPVTLIPGTLFYFYL